MTAINSECPIEAQERLTWADGPGSITDKFYLFTTLAEDAMHDFRLGKRDRIAARNAVGKTVIGSLLYKEHSGTDEFWPEFLQVGTADVLSPAGQQRLLEVAGQAEHYAANGMVLWATGDTLFLGKTDDR